MVKILIGLLAATRDRGRRLFRLRVSTCSNGSPNEVEAAFAQCARAAPRRPTAKSLSTCGAAPSRSRTLRASLPPSRRQPEDRPRDRQRCAASRTPDASRPTGSMPPTSRSRARSARKAACAFSYQAPRIEVIGLCGPGRPAAAARQHRAGRHLPVRAGAFRRRRGEIGRSPRPWRSNLGHRIRRRRAATTAIRASRCATSRTARSPPPTVDRMTFTATDDDGGQDRKLHRRRGKSRRLRLRCGRDAASCSIRRTRTMTNITAPTGR